MARAYKIAVLPGDGIGKETVPEALKVLDAASRRFGFDLARDQKRNESGTAKDGFSRQYFART